VTALDVCVTDTHSLVWLLANDARLSGTARAHLTSSSIPVIVPTMVLAEICFLHARGRIVVDQTSVLKYVHGTATYRLHPLDEAVATRLPTALNIHDGIIVATALVHQDAGKNTALITKDAKITASGLIPVIW
jgi:PIN domain nuclease of toxin-antitoxin system